MEPESRVSMEAYNAVTGDQMTKCNFTKADTLQILLLTLCGLCRLDREETALMYNGNRIDFKDEDMTLEQLGVGSEVNMQLLRTPRRITIIGEMIYVFERHTPKRNGETTPVQPPPTLSFLDPAFTDNGYEGEFLARMLGDGEGCPRGTKQIRFYSPDGEKYCFSYVASRGSRQASWMLDSRPVFLHVRSVGTYADSKVNPQDGHLRECKCSKCV